MASVSIGSMRYDVVADTSKFASGMVVTKREIKSLSQTFGASQVKVAGYDEKLDKLNRRFQQGEISRGKYEQKIRRLNKAESEHIVTLRKMKGEVDRYAESERRAANQIDIRMKKYQSAKTAQAGGGAGGMMGSMAGSMIGRFGGPAAVIAGAASSVKQFMAMERAAADFQVLTGSVQKGNKAVERFRDLASKTPMSFAQISKAAQTMLSFGVEADKVDGSMRQLMDIAGGNAERFQSLALVFGQVSANTRLTGQDLLQFINAGFNPLLEISQATGKSMMQLRDEMSKGQVSFDMVAQAMSRATSEGGRFNGRMDQFAETAAGRLAITQAKLSELAVTFGQTLSPAIGIASAAVNKFAEGWTAIIGAVNAGASIVSDLASMSGAEQLRAEIAERHATAEERKAAAMAKVGEEARKQAVAIAERKARQESEQAATNKPIIEQIKAMRERNLVAAKGAEWVAEYKVLNSGASQELIDQWKTLRKQNLEREEAARLAKESEAQEKQANQEKLAGLRAKRDKMQSEQDKPIKVEVAKGAGAIAGSREEFQILRELQAQQDATERQQHAEAQRERSETNRQLTQLNRLIERMEQAEPVG